MDCIFQSTPAEVWACHDAQTALPHRSVCSPIYEKKKFLFFSVVKDSWKSDKAISYRFKEPCLKSRPLTITVFISIYSTILYNLYSFIIIIIIAIIFSPVLGTRVHLAGLQKKLHHLNVSYNYRKKFFKRHVLIAYMQTCVHMPQIAQNIINGALGNLTSLFPPSLI